MSINVQKKNFPSFTITICNKVDWCDSNRLMFEVLISEMTLLLVPKLSYILCILISQICCEKLHFIVI